MNPGRFCQAIQLQEMLHLTHVPGCSQHSQHCMIQYHPIPLPTSQELAVGQNQALVDLPGKSFATWWTSFDRSSSGKEQKLLFKKVFARLAGGSWKYLSQTTLEAGIVTWEHARSDVSAFNLVTSMNTRVLAMKYVVYSICCQGHAGGEAWQIAFG